jgi:hypothetical protein
MTVYEKLLRASDVVIHLNADGSVESRTGPEAVAEWEKAVQRDQGQAPRASGWSGATADEDAAEEMRSRVADPAYWSSEERAELADRLGDKP